jgi:hypothetical protein
VTTVILIPELHNKRRFSLVYEEKISFARPDKMHYNQRINQSLENDFPSMAIVLQ